MFVNSVCTPIRLLTRVYIVCQFMTNAPFVTDPLNSHYLRDCLLFRLSFRHHYLRITLHMKCFNCLRFNNVIIYSQSLYHPNDVVMHVMWDTLRAKRTRASQAAHNTPILSPWSEQEIHTRAVN